MSQTREQMTNRSKWLSWALRHDPTAAGIVLDPAGWTPVSALLAAAERAGQVMTRDDLLAIVAGSDKQRFALRPDGAEIRANQGHSVSVDLGLPPLVPPAVLYHGTADRFLAGIRRDGLRPQERQHVHLSADRATALQVGSRHGRPVVLVVDSARMHGDGHQFFRSANGVWLVTAVPAEFLTEGNDHG